MHKKTTSPRKSVQQLVDNVVKHLIDMKYIKRTVDRYEKILRDFAAFQNKRKMSNLPVTRKCTELFLRGLDIESCQSPSICQPLKMAMRLLLEYQEKGSFFRRQRMERRLPLCYENTIRQYISYRSDEQEIGSKTRSVEEGNIRRFLKFLNAINVNSIKSIRPEHVRRHFQTFASYSQQTVATKAQHLRLFFRFLLSKGVVKKSLLDAIPHVRYIRRSRLPDVWPAESIEKILNGIDRETSMGKRDYALCILVARLGLRIGDVRELQLESLDWKRAVISLRQQKTRVALELPMSEEIGLALIDYLKNGRPATSSRNIFIRHRSPYLPFSPNDGLRHILDKYRVKAGVVLPKECRKGFHSLRHSIATRLHEASVPLSVIATLLGHSSTESTRIYTRTNVAMLRKVALELMEADNA